MPHFIKQTNIEVIAQDYLRIANVNSLEELKKTDYWKHYQREIQSLIPKQEDKNESL